MEASTEWKMGGTHSSHTVLGLGSPTVLVLGISAPTHPICELFGLGLGGGTKVFYPPRPDYRRFKIPSFTSPGHTHSHVCAPLVTFSFSIVVMLVIRYHISNISSGVGGGLEGNVGTGARASFLKPTTIINLVFEKKRPIHILD